MRVGAMVGVRVGIARRRGRATRYIVSIAEVCVDDAERGYTFSKGMAER